MKKTELIEKWTQDIKEYRDILRQEQQSGNPDKYILSRVKGIIHGKSDCLSDLKKYKIRDVK